MKTLNFKIILPLIEKLFWLSIIFLLIVKFILITRLDNATFLESYKFTSSDSYDWLSNGINLFSSNDISFRNVGLPLIIKVLYSLKLLFLLPLINQIFFFGIIYLTYLLAKNFSSKMFGYTMALMIFLNFSFQAFGELLLSDFYAIFFIELAVFLLIKNKNSFSFIALGLSILFQNFAFFLLPFWFLYIFFNDNRGKKFKELFAVKFIISYVKSNFLRFVKYFIAFLNINLAWFLYKAIELGNPFYTGLDYFSLIRPNPNSIPYYLVNGFTMFGLTFFVVLFAILFFYKKFKFNLQLTFLIALLLFNLFFWVIIYDWDDRRFFLYLIPFIYPLFAYILWKLYKNKLLLVVMFLVVFSIFPTMLYKFGFFDSYKIHLTNSDRIEFPGTFRQMYFIHEELQPLYAYLNPYYYDRYLNRDSYRAEFSSYDHYSEILDNYYDSQNKTLCKTEDYDMYTLRSVFFIKYRENFGKTELIENCF